MKLLAFRGHSRWRRRPQIKAIENADRRRSQGHPDHPREFHRRSPAVKKARAAGILVIALDTQLGDKDAADMTFATDNFQAGVLIGKWAKATLGDKAKDAQIGMLDINGQQLGRLAAPQRLPHGLRHRGPESEVHFRERQPRHRPANSNGRADRGRRRSRRPGKGPEHDLVYTINEPAADGGYRRAQERRARRRA